jgi:hypothetical protein
MCAGLYYSVSWVMGWPTSCAKTPWPRPADGASPTPSKTPAVMGTDGIDVATCCVAKCWATRSRLADCTHAMVQNAGTSPAAYLFDTCCLQNAERAGLNLPCGRRCSERSYVQREFCRQMALPAPHTCSAMPVAAMSAVPSRSPACMNQNWKQRSGRQIYALTIYSLPQGHLLLGLKASRRWLLDVINDNLTPDNLIAWL